MSNHGGMGVQSLRSYIIHTRRYWLELPASIDGSLLGPFISSRLWPVDRVPPCLLTPLLFPFRRDMHDLHFVSHHQLVSEEQCHPPEVTKRNLWEGGMPAAAAGKRTRALSGGHGVEQRLSHCFQCKGTVLNNI